MPLTSPLNSFVVTFTPSLTLSAPLCSTTLIQNRPPFHDHPQSHTSPEPFLIDLQEASMGLPQYLYDKREARELGKEKGLREEDLRKGGGRRKK